MPVDGDQRQRGEHARDVEPEPGLDDAEGEARALAGRTGRDLGHDGADQRQPAADPQAAEEVGQGGRHAQVEELLPPARAVELHEFDQAVVGRGEPERRVGQDGEEGDQEGADQHRASRVRDRSAAAARSRRSGVTCRITAKGKKLRSIHFACANSMASTTLPTVASASASTVIRSVTSSEPDRMPQSLTSVAR